MTSDFQVLDCGSGTFPRGDVNCDLYPTDVGHRGASRNHPQGNPERFDYAFDPKKIKNFVLCDVRRLPFKNEAFELVCSSHVIEHLDEPQKFLMELLRVARFRVLVKCPHRMGERFALRKNKFHKQFLNKTWFIRAIKPTGYSMQDPEISKYRHVPHEFFSLFRLPLEMTVEIFKV